MTTKQLREWLFQNSQDDQWWMSLDAVTEDCPVTVNDIEERLKSGQYGQAQVLHVSHGDMAHPTWIEVVLQAPPQQRALPATAQRSLPQAPPMVAPSAVGSSAAGKTQAPQETLGVIILLIPLVAALLSWFWIGSMNLLQNPGSTLSFLAIGTVILTGILVGVEANQLGIGAAGDTDKKGRKKTGPVGWGAVTMLLWIVGYPAYLYYRSKYGAKNMVVGGIVVALVFLGAISFMNAAIEDQKSNVRDQIDRSAQEMERIQRDLERELQSIQDTYE
jgi:hypothetical protein